MLNKSDFVKSLIKDIIGAARLTAVVSFVRPTIVKQTSMQDTQSK